MTSPAFFSVVSRFVLQFQKLGAIPYSQKGSVSTQTKKQMLELLGGKAVKEKPDIGGGARVCSLTCCVRQRPC